MARLPACQPKRVLRALERAGFFIHHTSGRYTDYLSKWIGCLNTTAFSGSYSVQPVVRVRKELLREAQGAALIQGSRVRHFRRY